MTVYASLPLELFDKDLRCLWADFNQKLQKQYKHATITSNYTGDGDIEKSDVVIFLYEFREYESCKKEYERCRELDIPYNFFTKVATSDNYIENQ